VKVINQIYKIRAPISKVWEALTSPKMIKAWGGGPVKMSDKAGDKFSFWGGDIFGKNTKVIKNKILVQDWYGGNWERPSNVTFNLNEKDGETIVSLIHTNLPEDEIQNFTDGWKDYYMGPLKKLVESDRI